MKLNGAYIILLFACLTLQVQAQTPEFPTATQTRKPPEIIPEHEINFMLGESFTMGVLPLGYNSLYNPDKSIGRFSFSYFYRVKKRIGIGITSTYIPYGINYLTRTYNFTETVNDSKSKTITSYGSVLTIAAEFRLYYWTRSFINMYGAAALGYAMDFSTNSIPNIKQPYMRNLIYYQATFFGVSGGKNVIGGFEIGFGQKGIVNMYIGYKF